MATSFKYMVNPNNLANAGEVSKQLKKELRSLGINQEIIRRATLAVYEGEINMIIHANGGIINVTIDENEITMELSDNGPGIADIDEAMKSGFSTVDDETIRSKGFGAGMGFSNMKKYSDEMKVDSQLGLGTTVTMKIRLKEED